MAVTLKSEYRTLRQVFWRIYKQEGILAYYRGFTATILGVIPYAGCSFFTYDMLKNLLTGESIHSHIHHLSPWRFFICGRESRGLYEWEWLLYMIVKQGTRGSHRGLFPRYWDGTYFNNNALVETSPMARYFKYVLHVRWWLRVDEQCTRWLFRDSRPLSFVAASLEWLVKRAATHWTLCEGECRRQPLRDSIITRLLRLSWKSTREYNISLKTIINIKDNWMTVMWVN